MPDIYVVLLPFAAIGWLWLALAVCGYIMNPKQSLIALDQWVATCVIFGAFADETISAMCHRHHWKRAEAFINWVFSNPHHCAEAYVSELEHKQSPKEYQ